MFKIVWQRKKKPYNLNDPLAVQLEKEGVVIDHDILFKTECYLAEQGFDTDAEGVEFGVKVYKANVSRLLQKEEK